MKINIKKLIIMASLLLCAMAFAGCGDSGKESITTADPKEAKGESEGKDAISDENNEDKLEYLEDGGTYYVGQSYDMIGKIDENAKSSDENVAEVFEGLECVGEGECTIRAKLNGEERTYNITVGGTRYDGELADGGHYPVGAQFPLLVEGVKLEVSDENVVKYVNAIDFVGEGTCVITTEDMLGNLIKYNITVKARP